MPSPVSTARWGCQRSVPSSLTALEHAVAAGKEAQVAVRVDGVQSVAAGGQHRAHVLPAPADGAIALPVAGAVAGPVVAIPEQMPVGRNGVDVEARTPSPGGAKGGYFGSVKSWPWTAYGTPCHCVVPETAPSSRVWW